MPTTEPFGLRPEEAVSWFGRKGYEFGFDWRDVWKETHARAFTVAKAMQADLLAEIRAAVDAAIKEGVTPREFSKRLRPLLESRGWWGKKIQVDPLTGEEKEVQLGSPRRLRIIYDTNLRQAHAAGRWDRIERVKSKRPYLRYIARSPGKNRRAEHQRWHDTVRPVDDPIWRTIAPMNGWGCQCRVQNLSAREVERLGLKVSGDVELEYRDYVNKRTGEVSRVPVGIDPGFDYNPGLAARRFEPPTPLTPIDEPSDQRGRAARFFDFAETPFARAPKLLEPVRTQKDRARALRDFAKLFGVAPGHAGLIVDPTGYQVEFAPDSLEHLEDRVSFLPLAKAAAENPFEIWLTLYRGKDGGLVARRRYLWLGQGPFGEALVVLEPGGWFEVLSPKKLLAERRGYIIHPSS